MSIIDDTLAELRATKKPSHLGMSDEVAARVAERARNAAIAHTALENAVLAAKSGEVGWAYVEHELHTAWLRWPSIDRATIESDLRELFRGKALDDLTRLSEECGGYKELEPDGGCR